MGVQTPFPYMPTKSTTKLLESFDPDVYIGTPNTVLYKFLAALTGPNGAGGLVNMAFFGRMAGALQTIYFNDLDYIFGKIGMMSRAPSESYPYNPMTDMLTSEQWDEVKVKDQWYRARIIDFFKACSLGTTPQGLQMCVKAAVACDCNLFEVYRYKDDMGITANLGRANFNVALPYPTNLPAGWSPLAVPGSPEGVGPANGRNEVVIQPLKTSLSPGELRLLRDMLDRISSVDTIVTVNTQGLSVGTPVHVRSSAASSTNFIVQRHVLATPIVSQLPTPEKLPITLNLSQQWLYNAQNVPQTAPYSAFNMSTQSSAYYLDGSSAIDNVSYSTLSESGVMTPGPTYTVYANSDTLGVVHPYQLADCPQNYPGGEYGVHPSTAPAINPDGSPYNFPFDSQQQYVDQIIERVTAMGGKATNSGYQLPIAQNGSTTEVFYPHYAIAATAPARESSVTVAITQARGQAHARIGNPRNTINYVNAQPTTATPPVGSGATTSTTTSTGTTVTTA